MEGKRKIEGIVTRVYSGQNGKCCCGCSGKYWERGEKGFDKMLTKIQKLAEEAVETDLDFSGTYDAVEVGPRLYIAYKD